MGLLSLLWRTLGAGLVSAHFGAFLEMQFWPRNPLGLLLGAFLGRNPPFLDPSYDPS